MSSFRRGACVAFAAGALLLVACNKKQEAAPPPPSGIPPLESAGDRRAATRRPPDPRADRGRRRQRRAAAGSSAAAAGPSEHGRRWAAADGGGAMGGSAGGAPSGAFAGTTPGGNFDPKTVLSGVIKADAKVKGKIAPGDVIFVVARKYEEGATGAGTPLAVQKLTVDTFPLKFSLDSRDAMLAGTTIAGKVVVTARVDKDGDAITKNPGDVTGQSKPIEPPQKDWSCRWTRCSDEGLDRRSPRALRAVRGVPRRAGALARHRHGAGRASRRAGRAAHRHAWSPAPGCSAPRSAVASLARLPAAPRALRGKRTASSGDQEIRRSGDRKIRSKSYDSSVLLISRSPCCSFCTGSQSTRWRRSLSASMFQKPSASA